ncbi:unnamed protein product [Brachionus calyciflorus]|uniref:Uncharacterized protein n=1 Tax=Brachionus calyciflorus TaxID=104777 RepID=A0A814F2D8_9BILA|nr:unnamed protein product [Brachionus calyciflorus]
MASQINITKINQENDKDHFVLYYTSDNTYDVIKKDKCSDFDSLKNTVKVFYPKSKNFKSTLGTQSKCEKKCKKYVERQTIKVSSTEDDDNQESQILNESEKIKKIAKDSQSLLDREFEKIRKIANKRQRSLSRISEHGTSEDQDDQRKDKLSSSEYKKWYNEINLLDFGASYIQKYISKLMDKLYTEDEMGESYVIDGTSTCSLYQISSAKWKKERILGVVITKLFSINLFPIRCHFLFTTLSARISELGEIVRFNIKRFDGTDFVLWKDKVKSELNASQCGEAIKEDINSDSPEKIVKDEKAKVILMTSIEDRVLRRLTRKTA